MEASKTICSCLLAGVLLLAGGLAVARGFIQNPELLDRIKIGVTTDKEVEQILGPPASRSDFSRVGLVSMDYTIAGDMGKNRIDIGIMIDKNGIVRDIQRIPQYRGG
jgi:hypothetical protein